MLEVLLNSWAVGNLIRENKVHQIEAQLRSGGETTGSQDFDTALLQLVEQGLIAPNEALKLANHPESMRRRIGETEDEE